MTPTPADYFGKADRALASSRLLLEIGDAEGACNRAYYAMFDAAKAALIAASAAPIASTYKSHSGLIGAFGLHLVKTGRISSEFGISLNEAERLRRLAYYTGEPIPINEATLVMEKASLFVFAVRQEFMPENTNDNRDDADHNRDSDTMA